MRISDWSNNTRNLGSVPKIRVLEVPCRNVIFKGTVYKDFLHFLTNFLAYIWGFLKLEPIPCDKSSKRSKNVTKWRKSCSVFLKLMSQLIPGNTSSLSENRLFVSPLKSSYFIDISFIFQKGRAGKSWVLVFSRENN